MAQGRFLSTSIATDPRLNSLSHEAHLVYLHMIPHLDRDGCITGNPLELWATVCPLLDLRDRMPALVQELCSTGLTQVTDDGNGLFLSGFPKNQRITPSRYEREAASKYTAPSHVQPKCNPCVTQVLHMDNPTPPKGKGKGKGQGQEEEEEEGEEQDEANPKPLSLSVISKTYESEIGLLTPGLRDELIALSDEYPVEWFIEATKLAVEANKRKLSYIKGILRNWAVDGKDSRRNGKGNERDKTDLKDIAIGYLDPNMTEEEALAILAQMDAAEEAGK